LIKYCVDTNIIVYTLQGLEPAIRFMKDNENIELIFSVIVEAELFSSSKLTKEDEHDLRIILELGDIIDINSQVALKAGKLRRLSKSHQNRTLKLPDALIAATAIEYEAVLTTCNEDDFAHMSNYGLTMYNPFKREV